MTGTKNKIKTQAVKKNLLNSDSDAAVDNAGSKVTTGAQPKTDAAQDARALAIATRNTTDFNGIPEQVAQSKIKKINHEWAGARQAFPHHKSLWYVDLFFPYADGGPLFVDQIANDIQAKELDSKKETMKKLGHRYLQVKHGMTLNEALEVVA